MLVIVSDEQPKIAMGLMSYIPSLPTYAEVTRELQWYQVSDARTLMLWKDPITKHFTAVLGVEEVYDAVLLRLVAFGPEVPVVERQKVGHDIYTALSNWFPELTLMGTITTQKLVNEWKMTKHD
ncbi:hypothetical protein H9L19_00570 [Weissella diestrammenae]|uniref:Reductase n=1 Tax=Weissella diestrammenae TaxID=1162633 RepID=A0A7G9T5Q9_9LACO|nr:hypothetical protein [Weissella diestrammenae]MCM0582260.1 hypothetical protein [Weissella diestrammenae]QNN75434.1 hypothetical protein H9L19_00570 [Weissella diestrammenae]